MAHRPRLLVALLVAGCGNSPTLIDSGAAGDGAIAVDAPGGSASAGCGRAPGVGYEVRTVTIDGVARSFGVRIPEGATATDPLPLVFVFHHRDGTIDAARAYGIEEAVAAAGDRAIVVYPQALAYPGEGAVGWEIGCGNYDSRFADAIYDQILADHCVDTRRVFATGFSWGADMTIAYGCCRSDRIRAIAPSSGTAWGDWRAACPTHAPALRITIGDVDGNYPVADVDAVADHFRARNGCAATRSPVEPAPCEASDGCSAPVVECVYPGMGHQIPPDGAAHIWAFFRAF
ncbi:MAG: hypothetical protein K8W52_04735 [Deltaproteobacteria bacterium]|nr:hypothetical protein [Deltaproteobacteria bacterium]